MKFIVNPFTGQLETVASEPWKCFSSSLANGEVKVVDTLPTASTDSAHYIVTMKTATKIKTFHLLALNDGGTMKDIIGPKLGQISVNVTTQINGANIELELTNNEATTLDVAIARLKQ